MRVAGMAVVVVAIGCGTSSSSAPPTGGAGSGSGAGVASAGRGSVTGAAGGSAVTGAGGTTGQGGAVTGGGGATAGSGGAGTGGRGGTGGAGGMGGTAQGDPCTYGVTMCDPGLYCDAPGCTSGTCQPVPPLSAQTKQYAPVCGCNGISYFNASLAEIDAMAVAQSGECGSNDAIACTKLSGCTTGYVCNARVANQAACVPVTQAAGFCWKVPAGCDLNTIKGRGCINSVCADYCSLMQGQNPWFVDNTCP